MEKLKILNLNFSFQRAAHYHINGGMLLMGVVLLAKFSKNFSSNMKSKSLLET